MHNKDYREWRARAISQQEGSTGLVSLCRPMSITWTVLKSNTKALLKSITKALPKSNARALLKRINRAQVLKRIAMSLP